MSLEIKNRGNKKGILFFWQDNRLTGKKIGNIVSENGAKTPWNEE